MNCIAKKLSNWFKWSTLFAVIVIVLVDALLYFDKNKNDAEEFLKHSFVVHNKIGDIKDIKVNSVLSAKNFDSGELYKKYVFYVSGAGGDAVISVYLVYDKDTGSTKNIKIASVELSSN